MRTTARSGPTCATCHNPRDWQATSFDHAAQTGFALIGRARACDVLERATAQASGAPPRARRLAASVIAQTTRTVAASAPTARVCHSTESFGEIRRR